MENASTNADSEISTIVSVDTLTLVITDVTIIPSECTVESSPAQNKVQSGSTASYTLASKSADGSAQSVTTDTYTVSLTCQTTARCGDETYTSTASSTSGEYTVDVTPTLGGVYDVVITMENAATDDDQNIDTTVDDSLTLEVIDTTTVPSFCTVTASDSTGDIVRLTGSTFTYTM